MKEPNNPLRVVGQRMTKARREIITVLETAKTPLSIQMIVGRVQANETSVYRTVPLLLAEGIIEEIGYPSGPKRYAIGEHHHHIICRSCGYTAHIPCDPEETHVQFKHPQFKEITHHEVTYYGRCKRCDE